MPFSGGTAGAHDDSMHQGNAKRDTAEGLAGLDAGGHVLAPGHRFTAARGAAEQITIRERTSNERVFRFIRNGANDYEARVNVAGTEQTVQEASMKDANNGIAGLDATGNLLIAGFGIRVNRSGTGDIHFLDRVTGELIQYWHRTGVQDYTLYIQYAGAYEVVQHAAHKDVANGIAGLDADVKVLSAVLPLPMLTTALFRANAATGTCTNPARINNNAYTLFSNFTSVGHYGEVEFDYYNFVTKYRVYGHDLNNQDGTYKIQHYEDGAWVDNTLNIPTNLNSWSSWAFLDIPVYTKKIRLVATVIDSHDAVSLLGELEIEG